MNPNLAKLQPYPFEKLRKLKAGIVPPAELSPILLSIGEPKHPTPELIKTALIQHLDGLSQYPLTRGSDALLECIAHWLNNRYQLKEPALNPQTQVLPVNGTREALFAIAQCLIDPSTPRPPKVMLPNPFYQIYEGAALLAGAQPYYLNSSSQAPFHPDFNLSSDDWDACQMLYLCSPGNPTGNVIDLEQYQMLIELALRHNFVLIGDECYSEIYLNESNPPLGLLQACQQLGHADFKNCLVFHSLSKRSNAPGLRSGFVAGDAHLIDQFRLYRTYHGCAMPPPVQYASIAAWQDEAHVVENRRLYREKFNLTKEILADVAEVHLPEGGFYLWLSTPIDDIEFTKKLYEKQNITVLPGSYLSREFNGVNPGFQRVRIALVADKAECEDAALRLRHFLHALQFQ